MNGQQLPDTTETSSPSSFADVVKFADYLRDDGLRPHYWEEDYVKRVLEAVRGHELKLSQASKILGVKYGTLYARYRQTYGCVTRGQYCHPRSYWDAEGPSSVVEQVRRGQQSLGEGASALGVTTSSLAAYLSHLLPARQECKPIGSKPAATATTKVPLKTYKPGLLLMIASASATSPLHTEKKCE